MGLTKNAIRASFWIKAVAAVALIALGDRLFYVLGNHGSAFGAFAAAWLVGTVLVHPALRRDRRALAVAGLAAFYAAALFDDPSLLAATLFGAALVMAVLLPRSARFDNAWRWALRLAIHAAVSGFGPLRDLYRLRRVPRSGRGVRASVPVVALPLIGGGIFLWLFAQANPLIGNALASLPDSKTGSKIVHMGRAAMRVIEAIPEVVGNPYLLPGKTDGTHVTDLQACWERVRAAAGLDDVRIHDLRHSFASVGAASGDSMLIIGALLGHSSPKTTERYTHLSDHPLKSAADRIAGEIARFLDLASGHDDETTAAPEPSCVLGTPDMATDPILGVVIRTKWLDTRAAAARLGFTVGTMQTYRWMGTGPAFRKIGRRVVYASEAVDAWSAVQATADDRLAA